MGAALPSPDGDLAIAGVHVLEAGTVLPEHDHGPLMVKVEAFAYVTRSPLSGRAALQLIVTV